METNSRKLKDGTIQFYTGRRKATESEIKDFLKNAARNEMDFSGTLPPQWSKYFGAVKGGIKRAENAVNTKQGRFMSTRDEEQLKRNLEAMGWNVDALKDAKKVDSLKKLFKEIPALQNSFLELIEEGFIRWYNKNTFRAEMDNWQGKVRVNGKPSTTANAIRRVSHTLKKMNAAWSIYLAMFKCQISGDEFLIRLPTDSVIYDYATSDDFIKDWEFGDDWKIIAH